MSILGSLRKQGVRFLLLTFAFGLAASGGLVLIVQSNKGSASSVASQPQVKRKKIQPDLPGTINGASDPASIPDATAYELFMRSIADYPSTAAFQDSGLSTEQIASILTHVDSFEDAISAMDQAARNLKTAGSNSNQLAKLQRKKEDFVERDFNHLMSVLLGLKGETNFELISMIA